jgi:RND superfamily putative drug exporter
MGFILANACIARAVETFGYAAPRMTEMFLVVVVFGAGTDYCLFLISRFKEHLLEGAGRGEAVERAVASVGSAIASSGATIIVGLASLYFAEFKEFGRIGPAVAFGLVIMLGIALTFAPSLMFVMGRLVFWPSGFRRAPDARENVVWVWLAQRISRHPWVTLLLMLMVFVPLAVIGGRVVPSYDIIGQLRSSMPSVAGFELLKRHFDQGEMLPVTLVMESDRDLRDPQRLDAQATLTRLLRQRPGVLGVRSAVEPYGRPQEFQRARFASQVGQMVQGAARGTAGVDELLEGVGAMRSGLEQAIRYVRDSQKKLVERSKGSTFLFVIPIPGPAEYRTASEGLAALAAGLDKISAGLDRMQKGLKTMREGLSTLEARLSPLADENGPYGYIAQHLFLLPKDFEANRELRKALDRYISRDGKLMRVSLIFKDPPHSLAASLCVQDLTSRLPDLMAGAGLQAKGTYLTGATATINDVRLLTQRDFYRVIVLVTVGVTIILFIQFRNVLALLYLMGTVLLSYAATMGIVLLVFHFGLGAQVDWKVRFLMFVIMVALGEDCNILIMSRITEERLRFGPYVGVERAIVRTGGIISSCGIIMAGTFSAMMASTLPVMVQLGFGIACGMLVDTFLVRPILLPAIILLLAPYKLVRTPRLRSAEPTASLHS